MVTRGIWSSRAGLTVREEVAFAALEDWDHQGALLPTAIHLPLQQGQLVDTLLLHTLWFAPCWTSGGIDTAPTVSRDIERSEGITAAPQGGIHQQTVDAVGHAQIEQELPLHNSAHLTVQKQLTNVTASSALHTQLRALQGLPGCSPGEIHSQDLGISDHVELQVLLQLVSVVLFEQEILLLGGQGLEGVVRGPEDSDGGVDGIRDDAQQTRGLQ